MQSLKTHIPTVAAAIVIGLGVNYVAAASTWVGPTANPPGNNADAPITVSAVAQEKEGKLTVGGFALKDGSEASDLVLASDANGNGSWKSLSDILGGGGGSTGGVTGQIANFDLDECPEGWSEYTAAQGRYIVGTPSGGTTGLEVGTALTDGENRAAGEHTHRADGYHLPFWAGPGNGGPVYYAGGRRYLGWTSSNGSGFDYVAGTNAPYIQMLICKKD